MEYTDEQLASLAKERPKNESGKRFVLSQNETLRSRLDIVKQEVEKLKEKYPEVLSLCLFGSMVKGTAHEGSDIDGELFIDTSVIAEREGVSERELIEEIPGRDRLYLTQEVAKKYILELREAIKASAGLEDEDVHHIRSMPISEQIIDREIERMVDYYRALDKYENDIEKWYGSQPLNRGDIDAELERLKSRPGRPQFISPELCEMFYLDVGGGIKKYRKMFVAKLLQLGVEGERLWQETIKGTEMMENNLSTDENKRYPRTLAEAVEVYG